MEHDTHRQNVSPRRKGAPQGRPAAFVSILEGSALQSRGKSGAGSGKSAPQQAARSPRTAPARRIPGAAFRKGAVRAGSEFGERAASAAAGFRKGAAGAARLAANGIGAIPSLASGLGAGIFGRRKRPANGVSETDALLRAAELSVPADNGSGAVAAALDPRKIAGRGSLLEPAWLTFIDELPDRLWAFLTGSARFLAASPRNVAGLALILATGLAAVAGGSLLLSSRSFPMPAGAILPDESSAQDLLMALVSPETAGGPADELGPLPPMPVMLKMRSYTVRSGESLASVAKRFGLRQDTVISLNNLKSATSMKSGASLRIPNMDGLAHTVRRGESLGSIARNYGIDMTKLADANDLGSSVINAGQSLFIPGAKLSSSALAGFYGEKVIWPLRGAISSPFGYRSNPFSGARTFHSAIDIVASRGTPVHAAMDGKVADAGYNSVFGRYVIISHSGGYQTLYGHMDQLLVKNGQSVSQNTVIGKSGNTGLSTGPHLHFSLFRNGQALDPRKYLK